MNEDSIEIEELANSIGDSVGFMSTNDIAENLKQIIQGENASSGLNTAASSDQDVDKLLEDSLQAYNDKYGLSLSPETLKEHIQMASFLNKKDKGALELVQQGIVANSAEYLAFKAILTLYKMIDQTLSNVMQSEMMQDVSMESVVLVDKVFSWVQQLEEMKEKYKIYDFDSSMKRILNKGIDEQDNYTTNQTFNVLKQLSALRPTNAIEDKSKADIAYIVEEKKDDNVQTDRAE